MDMQDKEMDDLFRSKLENLEVQPSPRLWSNISGELTDSKRKKKLIPFLSIAASIIVLFAAGVLFKSQKQIPVTKEKIQNIVAKANSKQGPSAVKPVLRSKLSVLQPQHVQPVTYAIANKPVHINIKQKNKVSGYNGEGNDTSANNNDETLVASVNQKQPEIIKQVVPDETTQITASEPVKEDQGFITKPVLANVQAPAAEKHEVVPVKRKHGINSFGDMVNAVVAKIDKRKDKFIVFSNTDGDEATITGVNLGVISIKKEEK